MNPHWSERTTLADPPLDAPLDPLSGKVAIVTGASSGIGRAIAAGLAQRGTTVCLISRRAGALDTRPAGDARRESVHAFEADLEDESSIRHLVDRVEREIGRIDILVHGAGAYAKAPLGDASIDDLDRLYRINVRGPFLMTQLLLPHLKANRGQIVFINSTQGLHASADVGYYAATKHALKAIADSLRSELNPDGVRVVSVFPGRTATPGMRRMYERDGRAYEPDLLLQPSDVAAVVLNALSLPRTAEVTDIAVRPLKKSY